MNETFNIHDASTEKLLERLGELREDRKSYGITKRSKKSARSTSDEEVQKMFKNVPPEMQEKFAQELLDLLQGELSGEEAVEDGDETDED